MKENDKRISSLSTVVLCVLSLVVVGVVPAGAQQRPAQPQVLSNAVVNEPAAFDVSPPLRDLPVAIPAQGGVHVVHPPLRPKLEKLRATAQQGTPGAGATFPVSLGPLIPATVGLNFDGISGDPGSPATENCPLVSGIQLAPPDTNLAVGDDQVVQWVNICYSVYNKATGERIAGPFPGNHFWAGFSSSVCSFQNAGDIIIQWDKANHRWMASQNVFGPYLTCVAVSTSADALGSYNRYQFLQPGFPDYPKWGLTPNVYYQTQNASAPSFTFGVNVCAYDAVAMRAGKKAKQICILDNSNGTFFDDSMLPADNDFVPPAGAPPAPEVLLGSIDNPGFNKFVYEYVMTVNFKKGTATLAGVNGGMPIPVPEFNLGCGGFGACIPQPPTLPPNPASELLDSLGDRLMYRLAHSVNAGTESWVVTHSVNDTAAVAARWYEFRAPSGSTALTLYQSGQTPDDSEYRWMGSIARDKDGNIALGYSRSSAAAGDYPSIYLSGQVASESGSGTTDAESLIFAGSGSQFFTDSRWGDYSSMALDGADGCTFWYTTEYYPFDGSFQWYTRIASLKFPNCH